MDDDKPVKVKAECELGCYTLGALVGTLLIAAATVASAINHLAQVLAK